SVDLGVRLDCVQFATFTELLVHSIWNGLCFFFFFSSRRRHTRSTRDWSSDVCSSDLAIRFLEQVVYRRFEEAYRVPLALGLVARSEERRVGKESSSRGWPVH